MVNTMRFVPASCLRQGMKICKTLYGKNNEVLLTAGTVLTDGYINRITQLKYNGTYIEDDLSKNIEVVNIISDELKQKTIRGIKDVFVKHTLNQSTGNQIKNQSLNSTKLLVENLVDEILNSSNLMINMVDLKVFDEYTYYHSVNVTVLSIVLGVALKLNREELYKLGLGALLHDMGKVFIPVEILNKPSKLTPEEFEVMKSHSEAGYKHVKDNYDIQAKSYIGILQHHERYDGNGYPDGKSEEQISLFGRIISICDVYDALSSDRPYRSGMLPSEAMEYIMGGSGMIFDPNLVKVFMKKIAPYPVGMCVRLSNNYTGIVLENYEDFCMRPRLRIYKKDDLDIEPFEMNLTNPDYNSITIVSTIF
jgi:HD-GYP domain-containing protein (c-di-GMP phosphodiesterase class II)